MDLSNYTSVIKKLSKQYNSPDFNELFDAMTQGESKSNRFLIKMEVNRISAPTRRILDFRSSGEKDVMRFEYNSIVHHLSAAEIALFKSLLEENQGYYTLGIHEDILAFHQSERQKPANERQVVVSDSLDPYAVESVDFGTYYVRSEERMHFSTLIRISIGGDTFETMTSDISTSGLRVKVDKHLVFEMNADVGINFVGLRQEFANNFLRDVFGYELVGIDSEEKFNYLRLKRVFQHNELDLFINKLISGNKHKYKVNVRYQEENVVVKGYEQFFLPRMSGLPIYISEDSQPKLSHVLANENNRAVYDYWGNEESKSQLEACFQTDWMKALLSEHDHFDTFIYSFYYTQNSKLYFYAASADALEKTGLKALFLSFAAQRPNFRVFKLSAYKAKFDQNKHLIEADNKKQHIDAFSLETLEAIRWVGLLQDITNEAVLSDYKRYLQDGVNFNQLHQFRLSAAENRATFAQFKFVQLRKEARFSYKTAIVATGLEQTLKGWTNDFSTQGLQVELEAPIDVEVGHRIYLDLPNLQKLAKSVSLSGLAYNVVGLNKAKTILHLHISGGKEDHPARQFFKLLISSNRDKLRSAPEPRQAPGLTAVLRNLYCQYIASTPLYAHKVNKHFVLDRIGVSEHSNSLMPLFTQFGNEGSPYNLFPLLHDDFMAGVFEEALMQMKPSYRPWQQVLYIAVAHSESKLKVVDKTVVKSKFERDFVNEEERHLFVQNALQWGDFYAIQVMLSRTGRPDMEYIARELNYVNHYASHRAQKLEDNLWSVQGVADLIDVTGELLYRLNLTPDKH